MDNTFSQKVGGANYLCMPKYTVYNNTLPIWMSGWGARVVWSIAYEFLYRECIIIMFPVLYIILSTVLIIPAKASCPPNWTREYYGYIMTEWSNYYIIGGHTIFECAG